MAMKTSAEDAAEGHEVVLDVRDPGWRSVTEDVEAATLRAARLALAGARPGRTPVEVAVVLADDAFVHELNRTYRHVDAPTNVLAFAECDGPSGWRPPGLPEPLGDVVIARETTVREAADQGLPVADHLSHLTIHGILHLLGYDHDTDDRAAEMERLEVELLAGLGIADPYRPESCDGQGL
jgi:probable rRNA maturation factor